METIWRVKRLNIQAERAQAEMVRVDWFKANPEWAKQEEAYDQMVAEEGTEAAEAHSWDDVEEFLEAEPGEEDALFNEIGPSIWLDVTGLEWEVKPNDNIKMVLSLVE